jgi:hypothetical protein
MSVNMRRRKESRRRFLLAITAAATLAYGPPSRTSKTPAAEAKKRDVAKADASPHAGNGYAAQLSTAK